MDYELEVRIPFTAADLKEAHTKADELEELIKEIEPTAYGYFLHSTGRD